MSSKIFFILKLEAMSIAMLLYIAVICAISNHLSLPRKQRRAPLDPLHTRLSPGCFLFLAVANAGRHTLPDPNFHLPATIGLLSIRLPGASKEGKSAVVGDFTCLHAVDGSCWKVSLRA